ncbi:dynein light chain Tctex-type 5 [Rhinichthys klamathensis goyatoka]|uniref:dynein light chain Tctex-type 5 n=1 Tax=Rhinichthys klamathensis goyatoka TaxID=3034132 RepID=UPI0024B5A1C9|nr:dynein light chain Tctex-type 5 [Rhinichthys klamathensis goyatoka]
MKSTVVKATFVNKPVTVLSISGFWKRRIKANCSRLFRKMSDLAKEKAARLLKKRGSVSSLGSHEVRAMTFGRKKDSISTVSYMEEPGHHDDIPRPTVPMENTYRLTPARRFPVITVKDILKDVLTSYLQEEKYEPELCRQMTKTISEVVKARVKELMIPRYKFIVIISIGQIRDLNIRMGSRCLWDETRDNFSSHTFKNSSLFATATVYGVYFE